MGYGVRSLLDNVVVVTGASSGIGRATARELVGVGATVGVTERHQARLDELVEELGADHVVALAGGVADPVTNTALVEATVDRFHRLDSVVAAAGVGMYGGCWSAPTTSSLR